VENLGGGVPNRVLERAWSEAIECDAYSTQTHWFTTLLNIRGTANRWRAYRRIEVCAIPSVVLEESVTVITKLDSQNIFEKVIYLLESFEYTPVGKW